MKLYIGVAASTRVGNMIGKQDATAAKAAGHASALLSVIVGTIVMIVLLATKDVRFAISSLNMRSLVNQGVWVSIQR